MKKNTIKKIVFAMYFPIYGVAYIYIYNIICIYVADFIENSRVPFIFFFSGICVLVSVILGWLLGLFKKEDRVQTLIMISIGTPIAFIISIITFMIQWHFVMIDF